MSVQARFIGGPWDGIVIALEKVTEFYEIAESVPLTPADFKAEQPQPRFPRIEHHRYQLYDTWPVKYLHEDWWGGDS